MIETLQRQEFPLVVGGNECIATELYTAAEIDEGIQSMGAALAAQYEGVSRVTMVPILQGAVSYAIALRNAMREAGGPRIRMDGIRASSYAGTGSTGKVTITHGLTHDAQGEHLLVVDDIFDTGLTLREVTRQLRQENPASVKVTTLLDKPSELRIQGVIEEIGGVATVFTMDAPHFVIGRGLDYDGKYRELDYIARVRQPLHTGGYEP